MCRRNITAKSSRRLSPVPSTASRFWLSREPHKPANITPKTKIDGLIAGYWLPSAFCCSSCIWRSIFSCSDRTWFAGSCSCFAFSSASLAIRFSSASPSSSVWACGVLATVVFDWYGCPPIAVGGPGLQPVRQTASENKSEGKSKFVISWRFGSLLTFHATKRRRWKSKFATIREQGRENARRNVFIIGVLPSCLRCARSRFTFVDA